MTAPADPRRNRFKLLVPSEIARLPEPEWLIAGFIPKDALVLFYGAPRAGKSFVALDWALSVAMGWSWLGRENQPGRFGGGYKVQRGPTVYIYAEGTRGITRRYAAWAQQHGVCPLELRLLPVPVDIRSGQRDQFVEAVKATGITPALIVVDTLARNFGSGDENQQKDMSEFVAGCDALRTAFPNATVVIVHHVGKNQERGPRGNTALFGAVDAALLLRRKSGMSLELKTEKQKDGEEAPPLRLQLTEVELGDDASSCAVELSDGAPEPETPQANKKRTEDSDEKVLSALVEIGDKGALHKDWKEAAKAQGIKRTAFEHSRTRLVTNGRVRQESTSKRYFAAGTPTPSPANDFNNNGGHATLGAHPTEEAA